MENIPFTVEYLKTGLAEMRKERVKTQMEQFVIYLIHCEKEKQGDGLAILEDFYNDKLIKEDAYISTKAVLNNPLTPWVVQIT